jgi:hypothetical protein
VLLVRLEDGRAPQVLLLVLSAFVAAFPNFPAVALRNFASSELYVLSYRASPALAEARMESALTLSTSSEGVLSEATLPKDDDATLPEESDEDDEVARVFPAVFAAACDLAVFDAPD